MPQQSQQLITPASKVPGLLPALKELNNISSISNTSTIVPLSSRTEGSDNKASGRYGASQPRRKTSKSQMMLRKVYVGRNNAATIHHKTTTVTNEFAHGFRSETSKERSKSRVGAASQTAITLVPP